MDTRSVQAWRTGLALVAAGDALLRLPDAAVFLSDGGAYPRAAARTAAPLFGGFFLSGSELWAQTGLLGIVAAACWLAQGRHPRAASLLLWWLLCCLHARSLPTVTGGDRLLRLFLLWSVLLPVVRGRGQITGLAAIGATLQVLAVYPLSILHKDAVQWLYEGDLLWRVLHQTPIAREPFATLLLSLGPLLPWAGRAVWLLEVLILPLYLWPDRDWRWRAGWVVVMMLFHAAIITLPLRLSIFGAVSTAGWLLLLPGEVWDWLGSKTQSAGAGRRVCMRSFWTRLTGFIRINGIGRRTLRVRGTEPGGTPGTHIAGTGVLPWLAAVYLAVCAFDALFTVLSKYAGMRTPAPLALIKRQLMLSQNWSLFSNAWSFHRCLAVTGVATDGSRHNLIDPGKPPADELPAAPERLSSARWTKHFSLLTRARHAAGAEHLAGWLLSEWNKQRQPLILAAEIFVLERAHPTPALPDPPWSIKPISEVEVRGEGESEW